MKSIILRVAGLAALAALAIPAAASAHPGIYTVTQRVATTGVTFGTDPTGATLNTKTQYVVANDGYAVGFTETAGSGTQGGMVNYKTMPTAYRADMTPEQKRSYGPAQTNLQPHATCEGVPALDPTTIAGAANILAWQLLPGTTPNTQNPPVAVPDPYFNYIPWQKTGVTIGADTNLLGETPAYWIAVVKSATNGLAGAPAGGVDLSALSTVQDFTNACTALGGTYKVADTASAIANSLIANAVAPLNTQITALTADKAALTADKAALTAGKKAAEDLAAANAAAAAAAQADADAARAKLLFGPLKVALDATTFSASALTSGVSVKLTGPAQQPVAVRLHISVNRAKALHLNTTLVASGTARIGADGSATVVVKSSARVAKAIGSLKAKLPLSVDATWGGATSVASALVG